MKRIFNYFLALIPLIIITSGCDSFNGAIKQGIITYDISYPRPIEDKWMETLMPSEMEMQFKNNKINTELTFGLGLIKMGFITNTEDKKLHELLNAFKSSNVSHRGINQIEELLDKIPPHTIELLPDTKSIIGFLCHKALVHVKSPSENYSYDLWYTKEIELKIGEKYIDLEFAIDKKGNVNIFQIRPLSTIKNWKKISSIKLKKVLKRNQKKFVEINQTNKRYGSLPIFGLMPDWNPAEMIGFQPNNLSYSIYKKIITDTAWNIARKEMGYKEVLRPLMYNFTGKPYIDARLSFYSFIPDNISEITSKKIVDYWFGSKMNSMNTKLFYFLAWHFHLNE